ncbi:complement component C1q receptor [Cheilinus undulatus]|uniref:complement component C1q receptor n=1 Tax=Cheilinus undulatus TaxID=241271 RepID=UPI001BD2F914|nr:complement component C1q receptor [Cheilinus undulatus]
MFQTHNTFSAPYGQSHTGCYPQTSRTLSGLYLLANFAVMFLFFVLQLILTFESSSGTEHETLCCSNACFTLHMSNVSFEKAHQNCDHNGGYLMTVREPKEEHVLRSLLSQVKRQRQDEPMKFWIGLKLNRGDCVLADKTLKGFKWVSGEEESHYSNWVEEPDSTCTKASCVSIQYSPLGPNQLKWTAGSCKRTAFYVCKFYFKGMCKPLALLGAGQITYRTAFSEEPLRTQMQLYPLGTYAEIVCGDNQSHESWCTGTDGFYWTVPGPFCQTEKQNCTVINGGCEHECRQDEEGVKCICYKGYSLNEDGLTCTRTDLCSFDTCEHRSVTGESGYSCKCPHGFKLDTNQRNCADIDECESQICEQHLCINSHGSYTCMCNHGYRLVEGRCSDVDECLQSTDICPYKCVNTEGSFLCTCQQGFHMEADGSTCIPDVVKASPASSDNQTSEGTEKTSKDSSATDELQQQSRHTEAPPSESELANVTSRDQQSNVSLVTSVSNTANSKVIICVLGSLIPLLLLLAVTVAIAIFRCSQTEKAAKKNTTTDGYCWVSSGFDPRLEKLYESILTDDL